MNFKWHPRVALENKFIPYKWQENLMKNGKLGGVLFVFVDGISRSEVDIKVKKIKDFCKELKKEGDKDEK